MEYLQSPHKRRVLRSDRRPEIKRGECGETCAPHCACSSAPPSKRIVELLFSCLFFPLTVLLRKSQSEVPKKFFRGANEPFARGYPAERGQVELLGETPNGLSAGTILRNLPECCQCNSSQGRRSLFAVHTATTK